MLKEPTSRPARAHYAAGAAALLALFAVAPACEDVLGAHFDEYEESACDEEATCEDCMACGCLTEQDACLYSDECSAWVECATSCEGAGAADCVSQCDADYPEGRAIFDDYLDCGNAECSTACAVTT